MPSATEPGRPKLLWLMISWPARQSGAGGGLPRLRRAVRIGGAQREQVRVRVQRRKRSGRFKSPLQDHMKPFKKVHLTASDCEALSRSQEGASSLTQPFIPDQSSQNSLRSLCPRPRRKKHSRGRQSVITDYFRHRAASSQCPPDMSRSRKFRAEAPPESVKDQGGDLSGEEGVRSLLEEWLAPEASRKRPRLSSDVGHSRPGHGWWESTDWLHLERPLDRGQVKLDAEVEPLPDTYFGLLGTKNWDVPRGCLDQLPDEVLQEIFALLPAVDLYRSLSLVCQRWHRVISDPQFIPWKKRYHQYLKEEPGAVSTVTAIMEQYGLCQVQNQPVLGFIRCVVAMKSHCCRDPVAILGCLRSHSLFPMAELCVSRRLPDMQDSQVSYAWATASVIVLLSGSVREVQELVACLQRPSSALSPMDVMEALYCMATLLYAMRAKEVLVNNRIHYNIFYCLYLLENSNCIPGAVMPEASNARCERGVGGSSQPEIQPTSEQQRILNHAIAPAQVVKIMAFAGTGKTSTLVKYAEKWSQLRFLYLAFNKTIAEQGMRAFPWNVTCKTVHSLAFAEVGRTYRQKGKLNVGLLSSYWVSMVLQNREGQSLFIRGKTVLQTLNTFFASADEAIGVEHTPIWCKNTKGERVLVGSEEKRIIVEEANLLWDKMKTLTPTREMAYKMTHDGYLKLWQLQKPSLSAYDVILVDEAQDCTPAIMDIVLSQGCGVMLVGDPHQQIYTFRGAVNALAEVPHTHIFYLTQSFRFGPEIAYVGATVLDVCKKVRNKTLVGSDKEGDVTGVGPTGKVARLSRNNQTVFEDAVSVTEGELPAKIHLLGGLAAFGLEKIHDLWKLFRPEANLEVRDPFFRRWARKGFAQLKDYATKAEDKQLEMKIAIVEKYQDRIPELVERISRHHVPTQETAEYILGTVHKAKGLEFDTVKVANDFVSVPFDRHNLRRLSVFRTDRVPEDEWNLLYVAVTRAKRRLIMPKCLTHLLTLAGEYYLRPELTSSVCSEVPVKCLVRDCRNSIPAESFLTMKKTPFVYSDGTRGSEGFLCHACVDQRLGPLVGLTAPPEVVQAMGYAEEALDFPQVVLFLLEQL